MITVGMNYQVLEGKDNVFEKAFKRVLELLHDMAGHAKSHLYRDVHAPRSYLILSEWTDRSAFDSFVRSEQFIKVTNWGKAQVLAGRPHHDYYEH